MDESSQAKTGAAERRPDALYQKGQAVARVQDVEVDADSKEVRFGEITRSDTLMIAEECEYQKYRVQIQRIAYASRIDPQRPDEGRILRGVFADLLGYRQQ